jgi:hypothetical protein
MCEAEEILCSSICPLSSLTWDDRRRFMRAGYYAERALDPASANQTRRKNRDDVSVSEASKLFDEDHVSEFALRFEKSSIAGWGVFANESIPEGQPIIEYIGELVPLRVVEERERLNEESGNYGSYVFRLPGDEGCIDATQQGGLARYINHSCDPNCEARLIRGTGRRSRIVLYSKRKIDPCEELSYDYKLPWESQEKALKCLCGAANCRGWLNWKEEDAPRNPRSVACSEPPERAEQRRRDAVQLFEDLNMLFSGRDFMDEKLMKALGIANSEEKVEEEAKEDVPGTRSSETSSERSSEDEEEQLRPRKRSTDRSDEGSPRRSPRIRCSEDRRRLARNEAAKTRRNPRRGSNQ